MVKFTARGLMPPVFTPLNENRSINFKVIPEYASFLSKAGIKSILVGGTTGEHMSFGVADRKEMITEWLKVAKPLNMHVQVQVGGAPLADVLELAKFAESAGADSILTLPELYFKPKDVDELVSYVQLVANSAKSIPVLYYHIPHLTNVQISMPPFVQEATARIENFKGIKFTSNNLNEAAQVRNVLKDDQEIFLGSDVLLAPGALLGVKSSIGTTYNIFPHFATAILNAADTNVPEAMEIQRKLSSIVEVITKEGDWVPTMKAAMSLVTGIEMGPPALPQKPLSSEAKYRILTGINNII